MKRSKGVTIIAIWFVVSGVFTAYGGLSVSFAGARSMDVDRVLAQLDAQHSSNVRGDDALSDEEYEQMREDSENLLLGISHILSTPRVRLMYFINGILGLVYIASGIGLWMLQGWARLLSIGQAMAMIPFTWWGGTVTGWMMSEMNDYAFGVTSAEGPVLEQSSLHAATNVTVLVGLLLSAAWLGFIYWFLNRPGIKAQFNNAVIAVNA